MLNGSIINNNRFEIMFLFTWVTIFLYVMRPWFETIDRSLVFQKEKGAKVAVASHSSKKKDQKWRISWPSLFYIVTEGIWHWQSSLRVLFLPKLRLEVLLVREVLLHRLFMVIFDSHFENYFSLSCYHPRLKYPRIFSLTCNSKSCCPLLGRNKLSSIIDKKHS